MRREQKFYICKKCGNLVGKIDNGGYPLVCCDEEMKELVPNTTEASKEKHLPTYTLKDDVLEVVVGENVHPMEENHHISWVYIETEKGGQRKNLEKGKEPKVSFALKDDKVLAIFAYCNLHGLWKVLVK